MFGFRKGKKSDPPTHAAVEGPRVDHRKCTDRFTGKYPHVGLYDVRDRKIWVCKPLSGQAIRTSHAALITGVDDATGTVWKDRFICFWFYTPDTGSGHAFNYPIDWTEAHLLVRIDPHWDYDRQRLIPAELSDQVEANLGRQVRHGESIFRWFADQKLKYDYSLHLIGSRLQDSQFYLRRFGAKS